MDKDVSKEIAFFNILNTALNLNLADTASNFHISINEVHEKIGIPKEEILRNIMSLQNSELVSIKTVTVILLFLIYHTHIADLLKFSVWMR